MRLLLDTHVAIWALAAPERLSAQASGLIGDRANEIFVSAVSVWEIAIKHAQGRGAGAPPFSGREAIGHFTNAGYRMLNMTAQHAAGVETLPPYHADPFDRLIVAQALSEPMRLLTHDAHMARYSDTIMRV